MKRASIAILTLLGGLIGCGGSSKTTTTAPSAVTNRVFVTNNVANSSGLMEVIDGSDDALSSGTFVIGSAPSLMAVSPEREITAIFDGSGNSVTVVTNSTETASGAISLPGATESIVLKDANTGFAAIRNASVNGVSDPGAVVKLDTKTFSTLDCSSNSRTFCMSVPFARTVALSPDGSRLLALSDSANSVTVFDTTKFGDTSGHKTLTGFDRPVAAAFSSDGSKAFVLNCGPECGGTQASVQVVNLASDVAQSTTNPGAAVSVSAGTSALLSGNTLYVAGTPGGVLGAAAGRLNAFDISSGAPVASSTISNIAIGDGYHSRMVLGANNKLFIGAHDCTNNPDSATPTGCLTIFDTSSNKAVIDTAKGSKPGESKGSVTGMTAIPNRSVVYVVSGGELRIYDTTTSALTTKQIDITGTAMDVKTIDQ